MVKKLAIALGIRSKCCGAKIETWHSDKFYCSSCHNWLGREIVAAPVKVTTPARKRRPAHATKRLAKAHV